MSLLLQTCMWSFMTSTSDPGAVGCNENDVEVWLGIYLVLLEAFLMKSWRKGAWSDNTCHLFHNGSTRSKAMCMSF